jgi:hypothetical protein
MNGVALVLMVLLSIASITLAIGDLALVLRRLGGVVHRRR